MTGPDNDIGRLAIEVALGSGSADELYRLHGDWLRKSLQRRLRLQQADIDDLVQDTYVRASKSIAGGILHPRAFLSTIALNLFRNRKRDEAVRNRHRDDVIAASCDNVYARGLLDQEASLELERLILEIPQTYRDVFALSRFQHMSNRDIAAHLGISVKTVEWRMGKALEFCMGRLRG